MKTGKSPPRRSGGGTLSNPRRRAEMTVSNRRPLTRAAKRRMTAEASSSKHVRVGKDGNDDSDATTKEGNPNGRTIVDLDSNSSLRFTYQDSDSNNSGMFVTVHKDAKGKGTTSGSTSEKVKMQAFRLQELKWKVEGIRENVEELDLKMAGLEETLEKALDNFGTYFEERLRELGLEFKEMIKKLHDTADKVKGPVEKGGWGQRRMNMLLTRRN